MITTSVKAWLEDLLAPHIEQAHTAVVKPTVTTAMSSSSIPSHPTDEGKIEFFSSSESVETETESISEPSVSATSPSPPETESISEASVSAASPSPPDNPVAALHNQLAKAKKDITWTTTNGTSYMIQTTRCVSRALIDDFVVSQ